MRRALPVVIVLSQLWAACDSKRAPELDPALSRAAIHTYAAIAAATYADSVHTAHALWAAIDHLLADPSLISLEGARSAWLRARVPYAQTEAFRFYDGPIDAVERWINTWPIDENYVESSTPPVLSSPTSLIDDSVHYPALSSELLRSLNMREGETSVSTGYHVIEFLLWGRDENPHGPGARPYSDYVPNASDPSVARRRTYLKSAAELLEAQLTQVMKAWSEQDAHDYRARFLALQPSAAVGLALKGMGSLTGPELAGERLTVPYETKDQENEHSCFSDNTLADLIGDARGIQNLCLGRYRRPDGSAVTGPGLCAALRGLAPAEHLERQIADAVRALEAIPAPFDQAILDPAGRAAIARAIAALHAQADTLEGLAQALHVELAAPQASAP